MKKLTLLIFLASITLMGFGQVLTLIDTDTGIDSLPPDEPIFPSHIYRSNTLIRSDNLMFIKGVEIITTKLILKYADECYRDSIIQYGPAWWYWSEGKDGPVKVLPDGSYIHREPTFPGFIEWLKKK